MTAASIPAAPAFDSRWRIEACCNGVWMVSGNRYDRFEDAWTDMNALLKTKPASFSDFRVSKPFPEVHDHA